MHEFTENEYSKTAYDYKTEIVLPLSGKKYTQINYVEIFFGIDSKKIVECK